MGSDESKDTITTPVESDTNDDGGFLQEVLVPKKKIDCFTVE